MKIFFIWFFFLITLIIFADQAAVTEDGRTVLLKDDGTWEYTDTDKSDYVYKFNLIKYFKGSSTKSTESFHIEKKPWHMKWIAKGIIFQIFIYSEDGTLISMVNGLEDTTVIRETGNFYLEIIAIDSYEIWIFK